MEAGVAMKRTNFISITLDEDGRRFAWGGPADRGTRGADPMGDASSEMDDMSMMMRKASQRVPLQKCL
jgi:hypothetical protein